MQIVIPTRGRTGQQLTLQSLPGELRKRTTLVCPEREASLLSHTYDVDVVVEPCPTWGIPRKREWIVREWLKAGYDKIIMLDDDLTFATRKGVENTSLQTIRGVELIPEFERIADKLGPSFPHVGFGQRQGNNRVEEAEWQTPGKMVCALGYYLPIVVKECRWDLVQLREDICITLQLLLKGYPNAVLTETVVDQRYDALGGCSIYRNASLSDAEATKLARLFPGYVSVVQREYHTSVRRKEVIVKWRRALEDGQKDLARLLNVVVLDGLNS
jgi:hypothetical protein